MGMEVYVFHHLTNKLPYLTTNVTNNRTLNYKHSVVSMVTIQIHKPKKLKTVKALTNLLFNFVHFPFNQCYCKYIQYIAGGQPLSLVQRVRTPNSHIEQEGINRTISSHQVRQFITDSDYGYSSLDTRLGLQFLELLCANSPFCELVVMTINCFNFMRIVVLIRSH